MSVDYITDKRTVCITRSKDWIGGFVVAGIEMASVDNNKAV